MKTAELRAKNMDELKSLVLDLKKEQFNLRMQDATGALEGKARIKDVRKTIARAKTLMTEAEMGKTVKPAAEKPVAKTKKKKG